MNRTTFLVGFTVISLFYIIAPAQAFESLPIGWASVSDVCGTPYTITGGSDGDTVTVTEANSFKTYATSSSPYVILVSGTMDLSPFTSHQVSVKSNKTIIGIGSNPGIYGTLKISSGYSNVIIRNLNIWYEDAAQGCDNPSNDGISTEGGAHHIWIDHCTAFDSPDGLMDLTKQSDYITVSWCKFYYNPPPVGQNTCHRNCCLVGSADNTPADVGKLKETYHHNWWSTLCDQRMPRVRYGQVHVFNNYYSCSGNLYCIGVGNESQIRVENNYFNGINDAWADYYKSPGNRGKIGWNSNNQFVNGTTIPTWATNDYNTIFVPPYSYTMDTDTNIMTKVQAGAGVNKLTPSPNPMTFNVAPYGPNSHSIAMTATTATCDDDVQYLFTCTAGGGHSSGWQDSASYTDTNLVPDTNYTYTVQARNKLQTLFTGAVSAPATGITGSPCTSPITSDLDADCEVDFFDYAILANAWAGGLPEVDLNGDEVLDWLDMRKFAEDWLTCNRDPSSECWQ